MNKKQDNITDFIKASVGDKPVAAYKALNSELLDRCSTALDDLKVQVTKNTFNGDYNDESS
jgi:hypothetical protein